jgi:hypothetical protein
MAVKSIATMAMSKAVMTWPLATVLTTPNTGIAAVGWITMIP